MFNKPTKFDEIRCSHFWENENYNFFLMSTTLNVECKSKTKKRARDIEFERDLSFSLGGTLGDGEKIKAIFLVSGIFPGKADSVILLGFECTIKPKKCNQNLWSHF